MMYNGSRSFIALMLTLNLSLFLSTVVLAQDNNTMTDTRIIIAHRGASGYIPEHTLAAKIMAHDMGADYIEQDVVLSRDNIPMVLHDIYLDAVSNVASEYPKRARADGKYYAIDFDASELKSLHLHERIDLQTGKVKFAGRPTQSPEHLHMLTLDEELAVIQGLNKSSGKETGIYTEIKSPAWHLQQGKDISPLVLAVLAKYGYTKRTDPAYIQCFDRAELQRIRTELASDLKLVQLIGNDNTEAPSTDYAQMRTVDGLKIIATYADAIGPAINQILTADAASAVTVTSLVADAHATGLLVHPYTVRKDALPAYANSFDDLMELLFTRAGVDGVFTDFPDLAVKFRDQPAH